MTAEDKELLIRDICARLPYGLKAKYYDPEAERTTWDEINDVYNSTSYNHTEVGIGQYGLNVVEVKPYLFPLSSITDEQKSYINGRWGINEDFDFEIDPNWGEYFVDLYDAVDYINWLNENHFDYRGLIEKGLAIDATNKNIY